MRDEALQSVDDEETVVEEIGLRDLNSVDEYFLSSAGGDG